MIDQFDGLGDMIAITDHNFGIILFNADHHRSIVSQWINEFPIHNGADTQKAQQGLILPGYNNIIWRRCFLDQENYYDPV